MCCINAAVQNKSRIDIGRLRRLSGAFGNYTVSGLTQANNGAAAAAALPAQPSQPARALPPALDDTTRGRAEDGVQRPEATLRRQGHWRRAAPLPPLVKHATALWALACDQYVLWRVLETQ